MKQNECPKAVPVYWEHLSNEFEVSKSNDGCFVLTPFLRPDGEAIELQLKVRPDNRVLLSDMGDSLGYLYVNGLTLTKAVMDKTRRISRGFSVTLSQNELSVYSDAQSIGEALHRLIQATLAVTDLIQTHKED